MKCPHNNIGYEEGYLVCQDCGLVLSEEINFYKESSKGEYIFESQREYERNIKTQDSIAIQDPKVKEKYEKLQTIDKWFRDYRTSFTEQKKIIELLKGYGIGLNIDQAKMQNIKERYLRYNRKYKKNYQNMVIIFLSIVWMEIKDITNIRLEEYIEVCNELGHKINKKMLNNAMLKVLKSEDRWKDKLVDTDNLEIDIKKKIKILFQKNLNDIPFESIKGYFIEEEGYSKLKIEMQLVLDKILKKIEYEKIKNLNYKAFTAGLIYYISQTLKPEYKKIFIQSLIEEVTRFSSTTIRKKYHILKDLLGKPEELKTLLEL